MPSYCGLCGRHSVKQTNLYTNQNVFYFCRKSEHFFVKCVLIEKKKKYDEPKNFTVAMLGFYDLLLSAFRAQLDYNN